MTRVFISHAGLDTEPAAELQRWLVEDGHDVFLDRDPQDGIRLGDEWEKRLHERLRWADAVVCVVTSAYLQSPWCAAEVGAARSRGSRMLPVVAEPGVVHPLLRPVQHTNMARDPAAARRALSDALRRVDASGGTGWPDGTSPYPGLVAFDRTLRHVFFGRSEEIGRFLELLRSPVERADGGFHLVVGPSGCGKSSLVRAGLAPALAEEPGWWTAPPFVPGTDPVGALARSVATAGRRVGLDRTIADVRARIDDAGLAGPAGEVLLAAPGGKAERLLVVVDQLEELLTQAAPSERARFAELVDGASTGPVLVVATLRSEFLDRFLAQPELADIRPRLHPVQPLRRQSLGAVVEGPARAAGIRVEDELVDRLVADTGSGSALPLLAFTLAELARDLGRGDQLSAARYDQLGGVRGALTRQADAALADAVRAGGRTPADVLAGLLRLVTVDEQGNPTGWRVDRGELPRTVDAELDAFVARRLLVTDTGDDGSAVIGVAHEAFLTAWPPLREAIDAEATALRARRAVEHGAAEWDRSGRPDERLWERGQLAAAVADTGARVGSATEAPDPGDAGTTVRGHRAVRLPRPRPRAVVTDRVPLSPTARTFLLASIRRDRLRRGRATAILSVLCVLALVTAGFAVVQQRAAQEQGRVATARQLIAQADLLRDSEPDTALRLDIAAERTHSDADTRAALVDGMLSSRFAGTLAGHTAEVRDAAFTADRRTMATGGDDGTVIIWDVSDERPRALGPPLTSDVGLVGQRTFSPDGRILATTRRDASVVLWDVADPSAPRPIGRPVPFADGEIVTEPSSLTPGEQYVSGLGYSPDGRMLAVGVKVVGAATSRVVLLDVSQPADARRLGGSITLEGTIDLLQFHPTGTALVTGAGDGPGGSVVVWDVADPASPRPLGPPLAYGGAPTFSSEARLLAAATPAYGGAVTIWDLTDPATPRQRPGISQDALAALGFDNESVDQLSFTTDAAMLRVVSRTSSGRYTVRLWDVADTALSPRYPEWPEFEEPIDRVATTPDGGTLAVGGSDGIVTLWDLAGNGVRQIGTPIRGNVGSLRMVAFLPNSILTSRRDGTMLFWDLPDPRTPRRFGHPIEGPSNVSSLAFPGGSETVIIGYRDGLVVQHPVAGSTASDPDRQLHPVDYSQSPPVFAPRTGLLAVSGPDGSIVVKDVSEPSRVGRISKPFPGELRDGDAVPLGFSSDGRTLAVSIVKPTPTEPGSFVSLWDVTDPAAPRHLSATFVPNGNPGWYSHAFAALSPDRRLLAARTGPSWNEISLIDISDPARPDPIGESLVGHTAQIGAITFSADGTLLATADWDQSMILWDVTDPARPKRWGPTPTNHPSAVSSLALSSDGRTLASGDGDGGITVWDIANPARPRSLVSTPPSGGGPVSALQFSPDGNILASGDASIADTWDLTELNALRRDPREVACERTGRGLDRAEWARFVGGLDYQDTCS
ncbi:nSTAND1 domain-containing NTPase [Pseudonocardia sp. DLS-67]